MGLEPWLLRRRCSAQLLKYQNITAKINNIEIVSIHSSYEISLIKTQIIKSLLISHFTSVKASHRSQVNGKVDFARR